MDLNKCLEQRKSCRAYKDKPVSLDLIGEIVHAALHSPCSGNMHSWKFIVIEKEEIRKKVTKSCLDQEWMDEAPIHIVICNLWKDVEKAYPKRGKLYAVQNCASAATLMITKAADLGLSSCWVGAFDKDKLKRLLNIPADARPEIVLTIGHGCDPTPQPRKHRVHETTFFNEWGNLKSSLQDLNSVMKQMGKVDKTLEKKKDKILKIFKRR